jgi:5-methyltetrahydrofolate--homocysteine methyltransferase
VQFSWVKKKFDERLTEEEKMVDFNAMQDALVQCDRDKLEGLVNAAMAEGTPATDILNRGLIAGMDIVGDKMENEDMFIPEVLLAAKIMGGCVSILKPLLGDE